MRRGPLLLLRRAPVMCSAVLCSAMLWRSSSRTLQASRLTLPLPPPSPPADAINIMPHAQQRPDFVPGPPRCGLQPAPKDGRYGGAGAVCSCAGRPLPGALSLLAYQAHVDRSPGRTPAGCAPCDPPHPAHRRGVGLCAPLRPPRGPPLPARCSGGCAAWPRQPPGRLHTAFACLGGRTGCAAARAQPSALALAVAGWPAFPHARPPAHPPTCPPTHPPGAPRAGKVPDCPPFVHKGRQLGPGDVCDVIHDQVGPAGAARSVCGPPWRQRWDSQCARERWLRLVRLPVHGARLAGHAGQTTPPPLPSTHACPRSASC